jgi:PPOX class probable F420-dependent enzyme
MQIDTTSEFGQRVLRRLSEEVVAWLTTVDPSGAPQPSPIWPLWDGETVVIYSAANAPKVRNIRANPRVSLNFDGNGHGGDIVILTGTAQVDDSIPSPDQNQAYLAKYLKYITGELKMTPESFAQTYNLALRVTPAKVRGH